MADSKICRYCNLAESLTEPSLTCTNCECSVHIACLKSPVSLPGGLLGDVFFKMLCEDCSGTRIELVTRDKISWLAVVVLVLYNLHQQTQGSSKRGYFHWKTHICKFIQDKWKFLFAPNVKRKKTWMGTVSGTLTHYLTIFQSGTEQLGETGWWRLHSPHLTPPHILHLKSQGALPQKSNAAPSLLAAVKTEEESSLGSETMCELEEVVVKTEAAWSASSDSSEMFSRAYVEPSATLSAVLFDEEEVDVEMDLDMCTSMGSLGGGDTSFTHGADTSSLSQLAADSALILAGKTELAHQQSQPQSETLATHGVKVKQEKTDFYDSEEVPERAPRQQQQQPKEVEEVVPPCQPLSQFEEVSLMHRLQRAGPLPSCAARRLLRKLAVRHAKRQRSLPLFNLDLAPLGYTREDPTVIGLHFNNTHERLLDRFQAVYHGDLSLARQAQPSFMLRLMGRFEPTCFHSPYTERLLKPYILRDSSVRAPWVCLMRELLAQTNKNVAGWKPPTPAPLDYSYVRPQHIATVNSLCRDFFWPGVDMTESLQYPDFTCVALYKKLVVGFAFLVPDAGYNESYISFLFVRPEWRRAGVASFMLYHLIQTCMGKDVTLHVSATNPALILYQKFGFKVEEFVQDFYEKYFPIDSKECRHALFLRLSR